MKEFPTLYKKTSTSAIQYWNIHVGDDLDGNVYQIITKYGQMNGKEQTTVDLIREGKNVGKKNETTVEQQAIAEAQAKWEKQLKKGYAKTIEDAQAGTVDSIIEGGVVPMLAQKFSEHAHKIKIPCYTQPKLDGIRCIAVIKDGACTLWSRTRKPITSCPHIIQELEALFEGETLTLDGELYNHEYKTNFEKIVSLVRQEEPAEDHYLVQYHIYDLVSDARFQDRHWTLEKWFSDLDDSSSLRFVLTLVVETEESIMFFFDKFREMGYEGAMLRNVDSKYVNKRSYDLQKVKEFDDAEFDIIGIDEGRGKLAGHVGAFKCRTKDGKEFLAKMSGETSNLRNYFLNHSLWSGKLLTVQYQGLTGKEGVPRFPVGLRIRGQE